MVGIGRVVVLNGPPRVGKSSIADSVCAHARRGLNVVVDVGHHDSYSRPLGILGAVAPALAELDARFVGLTCPAEVLLARREATGWSRPPPFRDESITTAVARWNAAVHDPGVYDLVIDTSRCTPSQAVARIASRLDGPPPSAFRRLAAVR